MKNSTPPKKPRHFRVACLSLIRLLTVATFSLLFTANPANADHDSRTAGVCARTAAVHDAIASVFGVADCANVDVNLLPFLPALILDNRFDPANPSPGLTSLKADDFAGLTGLTTVQINRHRLLTTLPDRLFDDIPASASVTFDTPAPTDLTATRVSDTSVELAWTASRAGSRSGPVEYLVEQAPVDEEFQFAPVTPHDPNNPFRTTTATTHTVTGLSPGTYFYRVHSMSPGRESFFNTDSVSFTATAAARGAPTANAGLDRVVNEGDTVTLSGAASTDSEGNKNLNYRWTHENEGIRLEGAFIARPSFTAPTQLATNAVLEFSLVVTNQGDQMVSEADTVTITVAAPGSMMPPLLWRPLRRQPWPRVPPLRLTAAAAPIPKTKT